MVGLISNWLEAASQLQSHSTEPAWLVEKRDHAAQQLAALQQPNRKLESWRYADAKRLSQALSVLTNECAESNFEVKEQRLNEVVIRIDDRGFHLLSPAPHWLCVEGIVAVDAEQWNDLCFDQETVVNLANTMLFNAGVLLSIQSDEKSDLNSNEVNKIVIEYNFKDRENWQYIRNQICLADHSQVSIEERFVTGRINVVNVYDVSDQAKLQRKQNVRMDETEQFISFNQFDVAENAEILNMNQHHGGLLQHHLHRINFNKTGSKYTSGTINKSSHNNNISDLVEVNHLHLNNQSDVTHRSIAKDHSQIFNNAKALVAPGADQSEIEQDLKNILLSPEAKIFSKPELEVYADEVVAAHGSTIGALDDQSLFYLQSRGIDVEQAREIMIESFEQEAVVC